MDNLRVSTVRVSEVGVSAALSFSSTLIEALWFRFETWFVVLVFLRAIIPVRGALVSSDVIDEEPIFKSKNFVYCV
jgi:hypothetical protein